MTTPLDTQVRLTEEDTQRVIQFFAAYIHLATRVLIFKHNKPGNIHHHCYFFNLDRTDAAIRKYIGHHYKRECFSVSHTCKGKKREPLTERGAYQYGTEKTLDDPVYQKGFAQHDIEVFKLAAEAYYKQFEPKELQNGDTIIVTKEIYTARQDKVWEKLKEQQDRYMNKSIIQIKSMISAQYLNEGKALPRQCDLHRYSLSLFYRCKFVEVEEIPEDALEGIYKYPSV